MYILRTKVRQPVPIPLPGRSLHLTLDNPEEKVTDEEYRTGPVQGRLKMRHISATYSEDDFAVPESAESVKLKVRRDSIERAELRARGDIL